MSGYLSHIAALSLNMAEIVQPRLAGMFEPAERGLSSNGSGNGLGEVYDSANEFTVSPGNPVAQAAGNSDSIPSTGLNRAVSLHSENKPPVTLIAEPHQPQQKVVANDSTQQVLSTHTTPSSAFVHSSLMEPQATLKSSNANRAIPFETPHKPSIDRIIERTVVERVPGLSPVIQQHHTEPVTHKLAIPDKDQKDQQDTKKIQSDKVESTNTTAASPGKWVVEPHIQTYTAPKESPRLEAINNTAPAPSIQVTVGRIEIRATPSSDKPTSLPRAAATTMSLDDYLNRRNGGKSWAVRLPLPGLPQF